MSKKNDKFGNRMKEYEKRESVKAIKGLPICVRIDGKNFSKLTKNITRPFCPEFHEVMKRVLEKLMKETNAVLGYTQSDEITLMLYTNKPQTSQLYFDGKFDKINSVLASIATYNFNANKSLIKNLTNKPALFDCRTWQLPSIEEAINVFIWRELDATKNSVSMLARHYFSHNQLKYQGRADMMNMLMSGPGVNWAKEDPSFKRGSYSYRAIQNLTLEDKMSMLKKCPDSYKKKALDQMPDFKRFLYVGILPPIHAIRNIVKLMLQSDHLSFASVDFECIKKMALMFDHPEKNECERDV